MSKVHVAESRLIEANPEAVYAVIRDYEVGHQAILPKPYFESMVVEEGGIGAGTVLRLRLKVFGRTFYFRQIVSEPEPGRVLVERDLNSEQVTRFTVEPVEGGKKARMTIESDFPAEAGIAGKLQQWFQPMLTRHIYRQELALLADYVENRAAVGDSLAV